MSNTLHFSWIDYSLFGATISINLIIGIYYGCFGTKQSTPEEYLYGGKKMKALPIGMSLTASYASGIIILGVPTEMYLYGTQYIMCLIAIILFTMALIYIYLPVYYKLQLPSTYEYLKLRFDPNVQKLASFLYVLSTVLQMPIIVYVPALVLNQVTGLNIYIISLLLCIVCIFYTTLGGLKGVVLSDTIQIVILLLTISIIVVIGTYTSGGIATIWNNAYSGERLEFFNMSMDPTVRQTFWGAVVGMIFMLIGTLGLNPSTIQRFLSLPTYRDVKISALTFALTNSFSKIITAWIGLILFTKYMDCDPLTAGKIQRADQLLPYYLLDVGNCPGLSGLFVAGVCGTAFSALSTGMNTLSLTVYEDFIKSRLPDTTSREFINKILKGIVLISGTLSFAFIFFIDKLGGVLQMSVSFQGITFGPLVGITTMGMLIPKVNRHGAFWGGIVSMVLTGIVIFGSQVYVLMGRVERAFKPLSTRQCDFNVTYAYIPCHLFGLDTVPIIFQISYYFHTLIGVLITIIAGVLITLITRKKDDPVVDRDLLSPLVHYFVSTEDVRQETVVSL
ncbi:hypothetical protein RI129_010926 [Pyrocoelia pectoralis]|uniref:Sodium-coupled monocarboxylate transporter 1 n=1 Tax=Pyrocoelia pectoralis TaxID=417401 RepID=A0AAN7Z9P5_9COLE